MDKQYQHTQKSGKMFFQDIEALRAIAVIMVMLAHFIEQDSEYYIPFMWYGVDFFFVISGFLITFIFIKNLSKPEGYSKRVLLKNFFIKRALRLFPAYYLLISFFFILRNVFSIYLWDNSYNLYFFTYFQNMYFVFKGNLGSHWSHLWSLGVEEQFYLIWPFILLLIPKKRYFFYISSLIIISVVLNIIFQSHITLFRILTVANMHTLGAGALLAYHFYYKRDSFIFRSSNKVRFIIWILALVLFVGSLNLNFENEYVKVAMVEISLVIITGLTLINSIIGWPRILDTVFKNRFLHKMGKISYGIYLYHMLIPPVLMIVIDKNPSLDFLLPSNELLRLLVLIFYTYLVSYMSYYWYEIYFLRLKEKLNYEKRKYPSLSYNSSKKW